MLLLLLSDYGDAVTVRVRPDGGAAVCIQSAIILHTSRAARLRTASRSNDGNYCTTTSPTCFLIV